MDNISDGFPIYHPQIPQFPFPSCFPHISPARPNVVQPQLVQCGKIHGEIHGKIMWESLKDPWCPKWMFPERCAFRS